MSLDKALVQDSSVMKVLFMVLIDGKRFICVET